MSTSSEQVIIVIIAVILILLFLGILFLAMTLFYSKKRRQMQNEKEALLEEFDKQLLQSKLEIQEQTFNFISGEIHDNVGQVLSLAKIQLSILDEKNSFDRPLIQEAKLSVSKALSELRDIAKSLSSERIQAFDLSRSVEEEMGRINKSGITRVVLHKVCSLGAVPETHKLMLFRVIQESLQNMVKHAQATQIDIEMIGEITGLQVIIKDNGIGFQVDQTLQMNQGLGLKNMQKRIALIGGDFTIESSIGHGTTIIISITYG